MSSDTLSGNRSNAVALLQGRCKIPGYLNNKKVCWAWLSFSRCCTSSEVANGAPQKLSTLRSSLQQISHSLDIARELFWGRGEVNEATE